MLTDKQRELFLKESGNKYITTDEEVDRYLRKRLILVTEQEAIRKQADTMIAQRQADIEELDFKCKPEVQKYVAFHLKVERAKRKSKQFFFGTVAFRTVAPTVKITDQTKALEWFKKKLPSMVVREEVVEERIDAARAKKFLMNKHVIQRDGTNEGDPMEGWYCDLPFAELVPAHEACDIRLAKTEAPK